MKSSVQNSHLLMLMVFPLISIAMAVDDVMSGALSWALLGAAVTLIFVYTASVLRGNQKDKAELKKISDKHLLELHKTYLSSKKKKSAV